MNSDIFKAVVALGKEKFKRVLGSGQMTIHAVNHHPGGVIGMGGRPPGHHRRFDLMARRAKLGRGRPHHGVIAHAEQRKGYTDAYTDENDGNDEFFHGLPC